jgi:hypothetical protein
VQEFYETPFVQDGAKLGLARSPTKGRSDEWANRGGMVLLADKWARFFGLTGAGLTGAGLTGAGLTGATGVVEPDILTFEIQLKMLHGKALLARVIGEPW